MNRIERIDRALAGEPVDRIPWSAWYHFGVQFLPGERLADLALEFYRSFQPDFLKVMHDHPYPLPDGLDQVTSVADLARLGKLDPGTGGYGEQRKAIARIARTLAGEAYVLDTVFDPWSILKKLAGRKRLLELMHDQPHETKRALEVIARNQIAYLEAAFDAGLTGVFYSAGAAGPDALGHAAYDEFCRPFDLMVLAACRPRTRFVMLHLHGEDVRFEAFLDYPVDVMNWAGQRTEPDLRAGRKLWPRCIAGGLDEETVAAVPPAEIRRQVAAAVMALGERSTIVAPGCAVPSNIPPRNIHSIPEALVALAGRR